MAQASITAFERERRSPHPRTLVALRAALEGMGLVFEGGGVRSDGGGGAN